MNFRIPASDHLTSLLERATFHMFVALTETGQVIGGLTAYTLIQYYSPRPMVYIFDLAVPTDIQRKGIRKQLMTEVIAHFGKAGTEEIFVQADADDIHALKFYRSTGGIPEEVIHFVYPLTKLINK